MTLPGMIRNSIYCKVTFKLPYEGSSKVSTTRTAVVQMLEEQKAFTAPYYVRADKTNVIFSRARNPHFLPGLGHTLARVDARK